MCFYLYFTIYYCLVIIRLLVNISLPNKMIYSSLKTGIILIMAAFLTLFFNFFFPGPWDCHRATVQRLVASSPSVTEPIESYHCLISQRNLVILSLNTWCLASWSNHNLQGGKPVGLPPLANWEVLILKSRWFAHAQYATGPGHCRKSLLREYCTKTPFQPLDHKLGSHTWYDWITAAFIYWWEGQGTHLHSWLITPNGVCGSTMSLMKSCLKDKSLNSSSLQLQSNDITSISLSTIVSCIMECIELCHSGQFICLLK